MSMRRDFTCARGSTVLATILLAKVPRVVTGVAVTHNRRFGTLELRCRCGQIERHAVPRKVETLVIGSMEQAAA